VLLAHLTIFLDHHHFVPTLGELPAGFSSGGSVLNSEDVCSVLLNEHSSQSENEELALSAYPFGTDTLIEALLDNVLVFVLYECDEVFSSYTKSLLASVYGPNLLFRWTKPGMMRDEMIQSSRSCSSVRTVEDCILSLKTVTTLISHSVDITESMKLPMKITSKLFSRMSILFSIPLKSVPLQALSDYLEKAPEMVAMEAWCVRINAGCKLWDDRTIAWRRKSSRSGQSEVSVQSSNWWEWLGWTTRGHKRHSEEEAWSGPPTPSFKPNKSHNVFFAMASVSAMFVYVALVLNSSRK